MKYKIIVDKQSRTNPSSEKREYEIDTEELRVKGDIYDSLVITKDEDYVMRRLELTEYRVLNVLDEPIKEPLEDLNIELFEGDNYIYLYDMVGNKISAEYMVKNDLTELYATKLELSTSIEQTAEAIMHEVNRKVDNKEFGTKIEQNWEHVKYAWNQISEFIQMEILKGNASLTFRKDANNLLMALDKLGQHFYKNGTTIFGEMGVQKVDKQNYVSFAIEGEYDKNISDGMAWGIKTKSDNKFWPILYIKDFVMPPKNSGGCTGKLMLSGCDLELDAENAGIISNGVKIHGDAMPGVFFSDTSTGKMLLGITPGNGFNYNSIYILDKISFYANQGGSNSFKIGDGASYVLMTDEGFFSMGGTEAAAMFGSSTNRVGFDIYPSVMAEIWGPLNVEGNVYAKNISSDRKLKRNIKDSDTSAIDTIKQIRHRQFEMKEDNKHYDIGYIAQELEEINQNFVLKREKTEKAEERYFVNELPLLATATKAIQEQQEMIEQLQEKQKQKDEIIVDLIARIETLEKEVNNG